MLLCWKRLWAVASSFLPLHESACLSPRPGTCGACHVRSCGSLCSEKKKFPGFQTGENT